MEFGVDEAGKGPVLGPMVAACVYGPGAALPEDVDDSKRLAPDRRERLAALLRDHPDVSTGVARVPTARIDDPGTDMNSLTVTAHAAAIADAAVPDGCEGLADAADVDEARFARRVAGALDGAVTVRAVHRADESSALVGAASVVAKVERDAALTRLAADYEGYDLGSGYPSDPATRSFLREYVRDTGDLPACARTSWKTSRDVLAAAEQSALDSF
ncbi:ribonuclease HII [Halomarina litorea]|uniref:ribonuclease HII n=1 Tax=Halomarina litorea TaxID=2961595 RepID=UPI0020C2B3E9|nr:ribonuclease HII [Halomarina sp. BCD28]